MKEGAENVQTKIQAKAESVLKHGLDSAKGIFLTSNPGCICRPINTHIIKKSYTFVLCYCF